MAYRQEDAFAVLNTINRQIEQKDFFHVYLLHGEEDYLRLQFRDKLVKALLGDDTMNYSYYHGNVDTAEFIDRANTLPFFSERRVIVLDECGLFKKREGAVIELVEHCPAYLYLIFVERQAPANVKLYKSIAKAGFTAKMITPDEKQLVQWVRTLAKQAGKTIDLRAAHHLVDMTGATMGLIHGEVEKLISYCADAPVITEKDVNALGAAVAESTVFNLVDMIGKKNQRRALALYKEMLMQNVSPSFILNRLAMQFSGMLAVTEGKKARLTNAQIAKKIGAQEFQVRKYMEQSANFSYEQIQRLMNACASMDGKIKTGRIKENIAVELLIIQAIAA